jgi:hypothetical protein
MHFGRIASAGGVKSAAGDPCCPGLRRFIRPSTLPPRRAPVAGLDHTIPRQSGGRKAVVGRVDNWQGV